MATNGHTLTILLFPYYIHAFPSYLNFTGAPSAIYSIPLTIETLLQCIQKRMMLYIRLAMHTAVPVSVSVINLFSSANFVIKMQSEACIITYLSWLYSVHTADPNPNPHLKPNHVPVS